MNFRYLYLFQHRSIFGYREQYYLILMLYRLKLVFAISTRVQSLNYNLIANVVNTINNDTRTNIVPTS